MGPPRALESKLSQRQKDVRDLYGHIDPKDLPKKKSPPV